MALTGQPTHVTGIRWRPDSGSWTNFVGVHNVEIKISRFSRFAGSGAGQVPGAPRIVGILRHSDQTTHHAAMGHTTVTGAASADADIEFTYKTSNNTTHVQTITEVIFVGTGSLHYGNKGGTTDKSQRKLIETPFEIRMDDDDVPTDFISDS